MNKTSVFKRLTAFILAMGLTIGGTALPGLVFAAEQYYIRFYDPTTKATTTNQTLVEGAPVTIQANLPSGYSFSQETFAVQKNGVSPPGGISDYFQTVINTPGSNYSLTPKELTGGESSAEFTLEALYIANVTEGSVIISSRTDSRNFAVSIVSDPAIPITEDSSLSFSISNDQLSATDSLSFTNVQNVTGYFVGKFEDQVVTANAIASDSKGRYIPITILAREGAAPRNLYFKLYLTGIPAGYLFLKDTVLRVSFTRQTITPLIATVITRQKAVDDTKDSVLQNPTTTGATTTGEAYVQLTSGETLQSIQNSFVVLSQVHRHNVDVELDWAWIPDNTMYQDYLQVQRMPSPTKKAVTIVHRAENDITGHLAVKAIYHYVDSSGTAKKVESAVGTIPIIIYGTGKPPVFSPLETYTGNQAGDDIVTPTANFPSTMEMDVYTGKPPYAASSSAPDAPYKLSASIFFGDGRGKAARAVIKQNSGGGELQVFIEGSPVAYNYGTDILNVGNYKSMEIVAKKRGQVNLQIMFYNSNNELMSSNTVTQNFYITDTTPSADGTLASLALKGYPTSDKAEIFGKVYPNGVIPFGFSPTVNAYPIILPHTVAEVTFTPRLTVGTGASTNILFSSQEGFVVSGSESEKISLEPEISKNVRITVTAQDGSTNSYTLTLLRQGPSNDATLSALEAYKTTDAATNLIQGFSRNVYNYAITVPYSTTELELVAVPNSPWVTMFDNKTVVWDGPIKPLTFAQRLIHFFTKAQTSNVFLINRPTATDGVFESSAQTVISATVTAEDGKTKTTYALTVTCLAPNTNTNIASLKVTSAGDTVYPFEYVTNFNPLNKDYLLYIPYSTETLVLTTQAEDNATSLALALDAAGYSYTRVPNTYNPGIPTIFTIRNMGPVPFTGNADPNLVPFTFSLAVTAESNNVTTPPYTIEIQRNEPNQDNRLKSLSVTDQNSKTVENFSFNPERLEYTLTVPYLTEQLIITPVANSPLSKISVNGSSITSTKPSFTTKNLVAGTSQTVEILVTAEDFSTRTYKIVVTRQKPSTEARLAALSVGPLTLKPKFNPNTLKYSVTIPEGTSGITVTPTTVSEYATITVNQINVKSGAASQKITPTEATSKINIVVTAQDGKTQLTYILTVTDENLIEKSDNADLYGLSLITANMSPPFKSSILDYEAFVKDDTYSVTIIPKTANRYATVTVYHGSKVVGDNEGNYAISLIEDENEITVEVVSQDKSVTKEYFVTIYRGDEEKQGIYKPIAADDVNYLEEDPIRINITKYPIVKAEVFNKLKTDYPEKTILFEGNDYTLSIKGSDMKTLIPHTDTFDLSISFSPPNEDAIWDAITRLDSDNDRLDPVYVHFNHHGSLPATMKFTISLGTAYRNRSLYWNYYNEERERIDYYGYVISNAKGTFSLPLAHMSTYILTQNKIDDAEDKVGALVGYYTEGKSNPNTGSEV